VPWLSSFYFGAEGNEANGADKPGLQSLVSDRLEAIDPRQVSSIAIGVDDQGREVVLRVGRYGPFLQRDDDRASVPEDMAPDEMTMERAEELLSAPSGDRVVGNDPTTGLPILARAGRYGPYVQLGEMDATAKGAKAKKPPTSSLFKSMDLETLTLDDALRLLTIPRVIGVEPGTGEEIVAQNGRFGPYLKKGTDSRSLTSEDELFSVTLEEALAVYAQPKQRRGAQAAPPLRELGADPVSGAPVVIKDGRFGAYITDGEVNVTVPRGETVEAMTLERAAELLVDKRAKGPSKPKRKAVPTKSTARKKPAAKKKPATKKPPPAPPVS